MEGSFKGLRKGAWTPEEDSLLKECIDKYGEGKWHQVPFRTGLNRCRKSCRLRWLNYLKPGINREKFSLDEVDLLLRLHKLLGNRWSLIAGRLPGRTANDVKNYWNTNLAKKQAETCCKIKMQKREITCSTSTPVAQKLNVISLPPRPLSNNNDMLGVGLGEVSTRDESIMCNNYEGKCVFMNNLMDVMDGESTWWEKCQEADAAGPKATTIDNADNSSVNSMSLTFDVDRLWSLFNKDIEEVD